MNEEEEEKEDPHDKNPFNKVKMSFSSKDAKTPGFISNSNNVFNFKNSEVDFDAADRYIYEFYHHPKFPIFKQSYLQFLEDFDNYDENVTKIQIGECEPEKKMIFLEILDTIIMVSKKELTTLPYYWYVSKKIGRKFGMGEFYIYLRPFTFGFLNLIKEKYDIAVYSKLPKNFLIFLIDIIQKEKEFFNIWITHETADEPKSILKFFKEGRTAKNTLFIDHDPEVLAYNSGYSLPVPKFEGVTKDSTLLYLQKYLIDLYEYPNISMKLKKDFKHKLESH